MHGAHPDLTWVRPTGAHVMRVDDIEGPVVSAATRTPFEARRRVFVLERVDTMNDEVANRLLKTLEEPASFVHLILMTDALGRVLETVVSRCQLVRFEPLPAATIAVAAGRRGRAGRAGGGMRTARARERRAGSLPGVGGGRRAAGRGGRAGGVGAVRRRRRGRRAVATAARTRRGGGRRRPRRRSPRRRSAASSSSRRAASARRSRRTSRSRRSARRGGRGGSRWSSGSR